MANPERGEVDFDFDGRRYVLKFSNAGKRVAERELGLDTPAITMRLFQTPGNDIVTVLFFGATRKYHARDFPVLQSVDNLMDDIEDTDAANGNTDLMLDLVHSLQAAFVRRPKEEIKKLYAVQSAPESSEDEGKDTDQEQADQNPAQTTKDKTHLTEAGASS